MSRKNDLFHLERRKKRERKEGKKEGRKKKRKSEQARKTEGKREGRKKGRKEGRREGREKVSRNIPGFKFPKSDSQFWIHFNIDKYKDVPTSMLCRRSSPAHLLSVSQRHASPLLD